MRSIKFTQTFVTAIMSALIASACSNTVIAQTEATSDGIKQVLTERGFEMLRNPSTLYGPGTVLLTEAGGDFKTSCESDLAFKDIKRRVRSSPTSAFSVNLNNTNSFSGNAGLSELASLASAYVREATINVSISNPEISEISDASLQSSEPDEGCRRHFNTIKLPSELKNDVMMVTRAFTADIAVEVKFKNEASLSAEAKKDLIAKISRSLGADPSVGLKAEHNDSGDAKLSGTKLIWGIKRSHDAAKWWIQGWLG